jgi:hypothetical protein
MRALLIDPFTETVTETFYSGDYKQIYQLIEAETFDAARLGPDLSDTVYVDDEGLLKPNQFFFLEDLYPFPLAGKGLVLGTDDEGDAISPTITIAEILQSISWLTPILGGFITTNGQFLPFSRFEG